MLRRPIRLALVAGMLAALLPAPVAAGTTPAVTFTAPVRAAGGAFWYGMDMGVDAAGHVHVVAAGIRGAKAGLWYLTDRTGTWRVRRILPWAAGAFWVQPSLALDARGRVHIAVEKAGCIECTIAPAKGIWYLSDRGRPRGTFPATPTRLTPNGTAQPSLRVSGGHRFLAFAGHPDRDLRAVRLLTDASGGWTTTRIARAGTHPSLRIGMDGRPRIAFENATALRYGRATALTGGWIVERITHTSGTDDRPLLSIDRTGGAHVAWLDTDAPGGTLVRYSHRSGGTWPVADTVAQRTIHALSVDRPARPWVAAGDTDILAAPRIGGAFQSIVVDSSGGTDVAIKVLDSGDVVVVWARGGQGIWVARTA